VFTNSENSLTGLNALIVLEPSDDVPHSVWLYVSNGDEIISDCLLMNLVEPVDKVIKPENRDAPPPILRRYLTSAVPTEMPGEEDFRFTWSRSGKDVAVAIYGVFVGFIVSGQKRGYSRALCQAGPWGNAWSDDLFSSHFAE
jgi:hypothetical protein